jgi:phenylpropionate dioxygenase-like ring-hydroxylating dioxygenase large terminal subunit
MSAPPHGHVAAATLGRRGPRVSDPLKPFANPDRCVRSWYVLCRGRDLSDRKPTGVDLLGRRVVAWRDPDQRPRALGAVCPHLGADLAQGTVVDGTLRCAFHHWRFDGDGRCVGAPCEAALPTRRGEAFTTREKHGLVWLYNGDRPAFELPDFFDGEGPDGFRRVLVPPLHLNCHPHLAIANGLDATHLDKLHGLDFTAEPTLRQLDAHTLQLAIRGRPRSRWLRAITRTHRIDVQATFTTFGSSIAWLTFTAPIRFHVVFTARPDAQGQTDTRTIIYLPRGLGWRAGRAAVTLLTVLHADRPVLNAIRFHRGFTESDHAQARFAELVDTMECEP